MAICRLILVVLASGSVYADATQSSSTTCLSTKENAFRKFEMTTYNGGAMSSYGKFNALSDKGNELTGFLFEQPTIDGRASYQGQSVEARGAPVEFFVLVDGNQSVLFFRDITVMGPTGWRRQNVICTN